MAAAGRRSSWRSREARKCTTSARRLRNATGSANSSASSGTMADASRSIRMKWLTRHIPTRDTIHHYRLLRPFAPHLRHPALWRMTHRSVPRAVALGLFVGVIIPVMHTAIAALLAIPLRANVAITAAFTLVVNPLTIPAIYYAAYRIGA